MEQKIRIHLHDPNQLEKLYREDRLGFKRAFNNIYPELKDALLARYWNERLNYANGGFTWRSVLSYVIIAALISGLIARIPALFPISEEMFYVRNAGFIVFPALTGYFVWKNQILGTKLALLSGLVILACLYINLLPGTMDNDTFMLACLHLPLLLWGILGMAYSKNATLNLESRLNYLKFNGDLVVMSALIGLAGVILTGITFGLFGVIGLDIEEFYFENIALFLLPAIPIVGTYLTQTNPGLVGKVSPAIAKLFTPLVLVMLIAYLIAIVYTGQNIYHDREFLLMFNLLLVGVLAIVYFSVAGRSDAQPSRWELVLLMVLTTLTIGINIFALSAIGFRISEWGMTPNRAAVLGANVLILVNMVLVVIQFIKILARKADLLLVGDTIARYLPVYIIWALGVVVLFPIVFGLS